jgi:hypothetical protein
MSLKLYEITNGIIDAQHETVNTDQLDALQVAFDEKAVGCACVIKNLTGEISAIDAEIKRLSDLRNARQNNVDRLRAYLLSCMQAAGIKKVENGVHGLRIQKNSQLSINVLDADRVPVRFKEIVTETRIDRKAIAAEVKASGEIPDGVDARQGEHLRIK